MQGHTSMNSNSSRRENLRLLPDSNFSCSSVEYFVKKKKGRQL